MVLGFVSAGFPWRQKVSRRCLMCHDAGGMERKGGGEEGEEVGGGMGPNVAQVEVGSRGPKKGKPRLTVEEKVMEGLVRKAEEIEVPPSKLANFVLDTYLGEIERILFGKNGLKDVERIEADARKIDAVFFSEGALWDHEKLSHVTAMDFFFEQYNIHTNLSDFEECDSCGDLFMLKGVAEKYELEDFDASEAYKKFLTMYVETYAESGRLFAFRGVVNLVDRLRNGGLRIVVTTNATRPKAEANARAIGLRVSDFCFTISEDSSVPVSRSEALRQTMQELGLEPSRCVSVDVEPSGVLAAKEAEMRSVAVALKRSLDALRSSKPDVIREEPCLITLEDVHGGPLYENASAVILEGSGTDDAHPVEDEEAPTEETNHTGRDTTS